MKCELRVHVPKGYRVPKGFELVLVTDPSDDFPIREYRGDVRADYRAVSTLALRLNANERAVYEASDLNTQDVGLVYYPHPLQLAGV